ncbi:hypothetical protein BD779DRAFT_1471732 [Infundibulicybe gibba]|nr:hypothetical protein BD779DRAFT_1471732 [Infundibulicybe gibba]
MALHSFDNVAFDTPAAPENPGIVPTPVVARPPGLMEMIWRIEPVLGTSCYHISAGHGHAIDNNGIVSLSDEHQMWRLVHHGDNVYSIVKCHDKERGWLLENGQPGTPVN